MWTAFNQRTIGRDQELGAVPNLQDLGNPDGNGSVGTIVFSGPPGIGKTHLLHMVEAGAAAAGAVVLRGGCIWLPGVIESSVPYGPFREAIANRTLAGARDTAAAAALQQLATWAEPVEATPDTGAARLDPTVHRQERFLKALHEVAAAQPVVLVLDDVHWADRSSLALLVRLVRSTRGRPLLVVLATRPPGELALGEAATTLLHLRRLTGVHWIDIPPLSEAEVAELIGDASLSVQRRRRVVALAQGNPLAALELARSPGDVSVPVTVEASVLQRRCALSADARLWADTVAVLEPRADPATAMAVVGQLAGTQGRSGPSEETLDAAVGEVMDAGLVVRSGGRYRFGHALERAAVYDALGPGRRARLHVTAAAVLMPTLSDEDAEGWAAAAMHLQVGGDRPATVEASLRAARAAQAVGAYPEAWRHQTQALAYGDDQAAWPGGAADVDEATINAAEFARWAGQPQDGLVTLERRVRGRRTPSAVLWERIGWFRREIGDDEGAETAYLAAVAALSADAEPLIRAQVLAGLAALQMTHFRTSEALATCHEAFALLEEEPACTPLAQLLNTEGVALAMGGDAEAGLKRLHRARDVALAVGDEAAVWRYVGNVTFVLLNGDRTAEAVDIALAAQRRAANSGVERSLSVLPVTTNLVSGLMSLGRWQEARDLLDATLAGDPPPARASVLLSYRGTLNAWAGWREAAEGDLDAARQIAQSTVDPTVRMMLDALEAQIALQSADLGRARSAVDAALALAVLGDDDEARLRHLATGLQVEAELGDPRVGIGAGAHVPPVRVQQLADLLAQSPQEPALLRSLAEGELYRCLAQDTASMWGAVAERAGRVHEPYTAAYAHLRRTDAALRGHDRRGAAAALLDARRTVGPLRPCALADELERLAKRSRLTEPDVTATADYRPPRAAALGLTRREVEVLVVLTEGASNRQIARALSMSERTASVHVSRVLSKLGVTSRLEAASLTHRQRLLDPA